MRFDMLRGEEAGKEEIVSSDVIEDMKQSPEGIWYATRYLHRSKASPELSEKLNGAKYLEWEHLFYVDFDADIPDCAFRTTKRLANGFVCTLEKLSELPCLITEQISEGGRDVREFEFEVFVAEAFGNDVAAEEG